MIGCCGDDEVMISWGGRVPIGWNSLGHYGALDLYSDGQEASVELEMAIDPAAC